MPGCLGLDAHVADERLLPRLAGRTRQGHARCRPARSSSPAWSRRRVKKVEYGVDFKRVMRGRLVLGIADGWLKADGETIYEATDLRVGLFKQTAA